MRIEPMTSWFRIESSIDYITILSFLSLNSLFQVRNDGTWISSYGNLVLHKLLEKIQLPCFFFWTIKNVDFPLLIYRELVHQKISPEYDNGIEKRKRSIDFFTLSSVLVVI